MFEKFFNDPSFDFETGRSSGKSITERVTWARCSPPWRASRTATPLVGSANGGHWLNESSRSRTQQQAAHRVSARNAYLRAAVYAASSLFVDGTEGADAQLSELFAAHRKCFDLHGGLLDPPAIPISVPYEDSDLPGYLFLPAADGVARPTLILNNGSDGAHTFLWPGLGQPGLDRGYNTVIFDGPGQQSMLFQRGIPFRPDWSASSPRWWIT